MSKKKLTQERVKELFNYNPKTGILTNKTSRNSKAQKGGVSGCLDRQGYLKTKVNSKSYKTHRLIWLYVYGYFPENSIDHINRKKDDNKIKNLRETSLVCNLRNCGNPKTNTSGVKGVYWKKDRNRWRPSICVYSKPRYLGSYKNFHNAVCARLAAEQCVGWESCDSSTPAFKYVKKYINRDLKQ